MDHSHDLHLRFVLHIRMTDESMSLVQSSAALTRCRLAALPHDELSALALDKIARSRTVLDALACDELTRCRLAPVACNDIAALG